jgi:hypothetical protein
MAGCPKGTPENPKNLTEKNWQAYMFNEECVATGIFPDDPVVRHNAAVILRGKENANALRNIEAQTCTSPTKPKK